MTKPCFFTSFNKAYLGQASVWARSLRKVYQSNVEIIGLVIESRDERDLSYFRDFDRVIFAEELNIPNFSSWIFGLNIVEAATAVKPFCLLKLLDTYSLVTYMDPDTYVYSSLDEIYELHKNSSVILTPHQIYPQEEDWIVEATELESLRFGVYNLGFISAKSDRNGKKIAQWWADRCYMYCIDDTARGLFTDQKIFDLAPALFDGVKVLRHPGYNIATWNIAERQLSFSDQEGATACTEPVRFCHFTKATHAGAYALDKMTTSETLFEELFYAYVASLKGKNLELDNFSKKWSYGFYDDGIEIEPDTRLKYRALKDHRFKHPNPFQSEEITMRFIKQG